MNSRNSKNTPIDHKRKWRYFSRDSIQELLRTHKKMTSLFQESRSKNILEHYNLNPQKELTLICHRLTFRFTSQYISLTLSSFLQKTGEWPNETATLDSNSKIDFKVKVISNRAKQKHTRLGWHSTSWIRFNRFNRYQQHQLASYYQQADSSKSQVSTSKQRISVPGVIVLLKSHCFEPLTEAFGRILVQNNLVEHVESCFLNSSLAPVCINVLYITDIPLEVTFQTIFDQIHPTSTLQRWLSVGLNILGIKLEVDQAWFCPPGQHFAIAAASTAITMLAILIQKRKPSRKEN